MIQLILVVLLVVGVVAVVRSLNAAAPDLRAKFRRGLFWFGIGALLVLAARGYLVWLVPLIGALIAMLIRALPFLIPVLLQYLPVLQRRRASQRPGAATADPISTIETRYLRMYLDQRTGEIGGEVIAGRHRGRQLGELGRAQLHELWRECRRDDPESATVLQAYAERVLGAAWIDADEEARASGSDQGRMTQAEAYQVLGLEAGASHAEIVAAHRRLMQRLHPDRGGSDYLAAKINQAKQILLER